MLLHQAVKMIKTDTLSENVGGRFALTTLVAKRLRAVNQGAPLLVERQAGERTIDAVCREIEEGKVWLESLIPVEHMESGSPEDISDLLDID